MRIARVLAPLALLAGATRLAGQLPSASPAALAMGDNAVASARGYAAVAWNPAALALGDGPDFSVAILPARATLGLHRIDLGVVRFYLDTIVPPEFHRGYVGYITGEVNDRGGYGYDGSYVALSRGRWGLQLSSRGRSVQRVAPNPRDIERFTTAGDAGRLTFEGARYDVVVASSAALSYALPLRADSAGALAVGATLSYTVGHALIYGFDVGSELTRQPLALSIQFPVIESDSEFATPENKGTGVGLDLGAGWRRGRWTVGAAAHNVVRTFKWDERQFLFRPGTALFTRDSAAADFDAQPWANAPALLRRRLRQLTFRPVLAAGVAWKGERLLIAADASRELGEGLELGPRTHVGVGAELRLWRSVPLRAGVAAVSDGFQLGTGVGVERRRFAISLSGGWRTNRYGDATLAMLGVEYRR